MLSYLILSYRNYKDAQWQSDGRKRQVERKYNRKRLLEIHSVCTNDPKKFWDQIEKLSQPKKNHIPMKVKKSDDLMTDLKSVCDWKTEFEYRPVTTMIARVRICTRNAWPVKLF